MKVTLNGGPFDGKIVEIEEGDHPKIYCGWMGDGYVRVYEKKNDQYVYSKTVKAADLE